MELDKRLTKLTPGQYRLWHDGHTVLVPVGQSTTKPEMRENVGVNVRVYGVINKSYFNRPLVDFTNTHVDVKRFDRFYLGIWRDFERGDIPYDDPSIDYHFDMGLNSIMTFVNISFQADTFTGMFNGPAVFKHRTGDTWETDQLHFNNFNLTELFGSFTLICNPYAFQMMNGIPLATPGFIQEDNLPITAVVHRATIKHGNSEMPLLLHNMEFPVSLLTFDIDIIGGE